MSGEEVEAGRMGDGGSRARAFVLNVANNLMRLQLPMTSFHRGSTLKILLNIKMAIIVNIVVVIYAIASCVSIIDPGNTAMKKSIAYFNIEF